MSLPENDTGEKINYIICDDDEIDYERRKETQKGTSTQDLSQDKNQSVVIVGSIPPDYIYSSEDEEHGPKMQVSHNSDDDAIEDDYAMEEDESDSTDNADSTTSCDSSEEGHSETNTNTTNDVCPEIRETRYVCGDFDYVEDNYKNKKSDKSESRKWEPKKGTLGKCKVRRYINECEPTKFVDVDNKEASEIFKIFMCEKILQLLVDGTNEKALENINANEGNNADEMDCTKYKWKKVTIKEMYAFIGVLIYMGCKKYHDNINTLFSEDSLPFIRACFSKHRFSRINSYLRYDQKSERNKNKDYKYPIVQEMLDILQKNFLSAATPSELIAVDERMCAFRGSSPTRIYMPNKPDKFGLVLHCLVDYNTKYCYGMRLYLGKRIILLVDLGSLL